MSRSRRWTIPGRSGSPPATVSGERVDERVAARARRPDGRRGRRACRRRRGARPARRSRGGRPGVRREARSGGSARHDPLAAFEPVALRARRGRRRAPRLDGPLGRCARAELRREEAVEPLAGRRRRDLELGCGSIVTHPAQFGDRLAGPAGVASALEGGGAVPTQGGGRVRETRRVGSARGGAASRSGGRRAPTVGLTRSAGGDVERAPRLLGPAVGGDQRDEQDRRRRSR